MVILCIVCPTNNCCLSYLSGHHYYCHYHYHRHLCIHYFSFFQNKQIAFASLQTIASNFIKNQVSTADTFISSCSLSDRVKRFKSHQIELLLLSSPTLFFLSVSIFIFISILTFHHHNTSYHSNLT